MKTVEIEGMPDWAIPKIDGIRADKFFERLNEQLEEARKAYSVFHKTYQMTHLSAFRDGAQIQTGRIRKIQAIIEQNQNLYCIVTKGFSLN